MGYFSFITGGIREDTYHTMFILPADGKMMMGSFHMPQGQVQEGKKRLLKIINSIQIKREARNGMYRMEKIGEYDETDEDDGRDYVRINPYRSMCYGTWEITEQLGKPCQSVNVGDELDIRENKGYVVSCRILDRKDERVEKVADWIGLGYGNRYLICCYFSQDCFWDYMIIRDGMTAVLAKGECIYWVKRISDPEKDSIYYELG